MHAPYLLQVRVTGPEDLQAIIAIDNPPLKVDLQ